MKQWSWRSVGRWMKWRAVWAIVLAACSVPAAAAAQTAPPKLSPAPPEAVNEFSTAANAQNAGEFSAAADFWAEFLEKYPTVDLTPQAEHYCGVCNLQLGRFQVAAQHFERVVNTWSKVPGFNLTQDAYLNLGACYFGLAQQAKTDAGTLYAKAAETFATLVERFPDGKYTDQALFFQGESLYHQGQKQQAVAAYSRLTSDSKYRKSPLRANGLYALGVTHEELGQYAEAGKVYDTFIQEFADHALATEVRMRKAETILQAGLAKRKAGQKDEAAALIKQAADRFAAAAATEGFAQADHALMQQALCQVELGDFAAAARLYARVATDFPKSSYAAEAMLDAGRFFYRAGQYDKAMPWLAKTIELGGAGAPEAAHWAARIHLRNKQPGKAAELAGSMLAKAAGGPFLVFLKMDQADGWYEMPDRKQQSLELYAAIAREHKDHELAPQALYNAAYTALELDRYDEGLEYCQSFQQQYAGHELAPDVQYVCAECQLHLKHYDEAERLLRELVTRHTDHPELAHWQVRIGLVLYLQEKYAAVQAWLSPLVDGFKDAQLVAEARFLIGASQFYLHRFEDAAAQLEASLAAAPKWRQADETLLLWSQSLHELNKTDEAIKLVQRLIREFPDSSVMDQAHYRYGQYSYAKNDFKNAAAEYQKVIDGWPDSTLAPYARFGKGWSQLKLGQFDKGVATFTALLEKHPDHALARDSLLARGMCRRQTKQYADAVADLASFLKTKPDKQDRCSALYEKGLCEVALNDYEAAIQSFSSLLETDANSPLADEALYELAWAYRSSNKEEQAVQSFRQLLKDYPDSPLAAEAHFHDGEDHYQRGDWVAAAKAYRLAKEKASGSELGEKATYKLGWALYQQQQYEPALKEFQQQVGKYPDGPLQADGLFMVAESLFRLQRFTDALPALQRALAAMEARPKADKNVLALILLHGGQSAIELKRYDEALKLLRRIPAEHADSAYLAEAYLEIGRAAQALGQEGNAVAAYEQAAVKSAGEVGARARFMIGEIYFARKEHVEAIRQFQRVIYGYTLEAEADRVNNWKAKAGYEAGRCAEVRIRSAKDAASRAKLIAEARKFYTYVITKHPKHELAAEAQRRLKVIGKLQG